MMRFVACCYFFRLQSFFARFSLFASPVSRRPHTKLILGVRESLTARAPKLTLKQENKTRTLVGAPGGWAQARIISQTSSEREASKVRNGLRLACVYLIVAK